MELTKELIVKAKEAKTVSELVNLAKENGEEISVEQAEKIFDRIHKSGELTDEELDNVAGGCSGSYGDKCSRCGCTEVKVEVVAGRTAWCCTDCGELVAWTRF